MRNVADVDPLELSRRHPEWSAAQPMTRLQKGVMIGLALVTTVYVVGDSFKTSFANSVRKSVRADYVITSDGGAGLHPGGEGIERDLQVLDDCTVSLITERRASPPWGLAGGAPGATGECWVLPEGEEARAERLPDKCTIRLQVGDVLRMLTPGGGGWGRSPEL